MYLVDERRKLILEEIIAAGTVYVSDLAKSMMLPMKQYEKTSLILNKEDC